MAQQTAVQFLEQKFIERLGNLWIEDFDQAKQMEKDQIIMAHVNGSEWPYYSEDYYNETYGKP